MTKVFVLYVEVLLLSFTMGETEKILLDGSDWKFQNEENSEL